MKTKLLVLSAILISGLLVGCSSNVRIENPNANNDISTEQAEIENDEQNSDSESSSQPKLGGVGDTISGKFSQITLNSVKFAGPTEYYEPGNGHFVILNLTVKNTSDDSLSISSLGSFELQGSDLYVYSQTLGPDVKGTLDSTLAPGASIRGEVAYDLPKVQSFELRYKENMFDELSLNFRFQFSEIR